MKVTLIPGIAEISGSTRKHGKRMVFMTRTNSEGKRETRMYLRNDDDYKRQKPLSDAEIAAHDLFTRRAKYVKELMDAGIRRDKAWQTAKIAIQ